MEGSNGREEREEGERKGRQEWRSILDLRESCLFVVIGECKSHKSGKGKVGAACGGPLCPWCEMGESQLLLLRWRTSGPIESYPPGKTLAHRLLPR
jgi:hypothetical protein